MNILTIQCVTTIALLNIVENVWWCEENAVILHHECDVSDKNI